ncbi:MAG: type II secretion system protein [Pseudomonadota bacterium]
MPPVSHFPQYRLGCTPAVQHGHPSTGGGKGEGFTLVEILVVIAIVSLLTATALPAMRGTRERTAGARARAELALIAQALESYRRVYGDYPQTGDFAQAAPDTTQPLATSDAQAKVFNALRGVFGPRRFGAEDRIDGAEFIDATRFVLERAEPADEQAPAVTPSRKVEACTALLDPWGRRYLYYYKSAGSPAAWAASGYVLYSAGRDGRHAPPDAATGLVPRDATVATLNADNVYADALMR